MEFNELYKIAKVSKGSGTELYKEYELNSVGTYRSNLTKGKKKIYYEYQQKLFGIKGKLPFFNRCEKGKRI